MQATLNATAYLTTPTRTLTSLVTLLACRVIWNAFMQGHMESRYSLQYDTKTKQLNTYK